MIEVTKDMLERAFVNHELHRQEHPDHTGECSGPPTAETIWARLVAMATAHIWLHPQPGDMKEMHDA